MIGKAQETLMGYKYAKLESSEDVEDLLND